MAVGVFVVVACKKETVYNIVFNYNIFVFWCNSVCSWLVHAVQQKLPWVQVVIVLTFVKRDGLTVLEVNVGKLKPQTKKSEMCSFLDIPFEI